MRTLYFLPGPQELPFEKGIINNVVVDGGEDEAKVIGGNVVSKSRRVEKGGENDENEGGEAVVERMMKMICMKMKAVRLTLRKSKG